MVEIEFVSIALQFNHKFLLKKVSPKVSLVYGYISYMRE